MGYETRFEIELVKKPKNLSIHEVKAKLEEISTYYFDFRIKDLNKEKLYTSGSWYEHKRDLEKLSSLYPKVMFKIKGEGEESMDLWCSFFQKGVAIKESKAVWSLDEKIPRKKKIEHEF